MAVVCPYLGPVDAAVGVGAHLGVQILHQVCGVLGTAPGQTVHIDDLRVHLVGKVGNFSDAEIGGNAPLPGVVVVPVDLVLALCHGAQGGLPVEQVGDGAAGIADGAEASLLVELHKLLIHLHGLGVKGAVAIEAIPVVDAEDGVGVHGDVHLIQIHRQRKGKGGAVVVHGPLQGGVGRLQLGQGLGFLGRLNGLGQGHGVLMGLLQLLAVVQGLGLLDESLNLRLIEIAGLVLVDGLGLVVGEGLVVHIELVHITTHGVGVGGVGGFVGAQTEGEHLVDGGAAQVLLAVQLTVDVVFHLFGVLVEGDGDVLPATFGYAAGGGDILSIDVGVVFAVRLQGEQRAAAALMLQKYGRSGGHITGDGSVVAIPHGEGGGAAAGVDVVFQTHIVVCTFPKPQYFAEDRVAAVHHADVFALKGGGCTILNGADQRGVPFKGPVIL